MNRETHPIQDAPDWPLPARVHHLEVHLAQLHDQVWWLSLPFYTRIYYRLIGFRAPIRAFYGTDGG